MDEQGCGVVQGSTPWHIIKVRDSQESRFILKLYAHQSDAIARAKAGNLHIAHDCGCGKTLTAIEIIKYWKAKFKKEQKWLKCLVVCPLTIIENAWLTDTQKFAPELSIVNLWDKKSGERLKKLRTVADIHIVNFEQFKSMFMAIKAKKFDMIIVDESSKMKNPKSAITQALLAISGLPCKRFQCSTAEVIPLRYCMSGTPAPNDYDEWFCQIAFLDQSIFGRSYYSFRSRWFVEIPLGGLQRMYKFKETKLVDDRGIEITRTMHNLPDAEFKRMYGRDKQAFKPMSEAFADKMKPIVDSVRKEDALDLPEVVDITWKVDLSPEERCAYDQMKTEFVLELGDQQVTAEFALTVQQKLRQLACGFIYYEGQDGQETEEIRVSGPSTKLLALTEILDHLAGRQVVVWASYKHLLTEISVLLGDRGVALTGSQAAKDLAIKNFLDGNAQYIIANPASGAHGLNFQYNAAEAVWVNPDWSWELISQSRDRIHRIGQKLKVTNYQIVARSTIEELMAKKTTTKKQLSELVYSYLKG